MKAVTSRRWSIIVASGASSRGTSVSFTLACVAVEGQETQVGYGFQAVRHSADLKKEWVIEKTVENTLALLGENRSLPGAMIWCSILSSRRRCWSFWRMLCAATRS